MTALGGRDHGAAKPVKQSHLCVDNRSTSEVLKTPRSGDVNPRTRRLLLIMPGILMAFVSLCLLTAYVCVTQKWPERKSDRSQIHEEKFLLVSSHDGHRTWNHVTVDGTENMVEVEVPTFGKFQQSVIVYDFEEGFMANKDIDRKRCFLKRIHDFLERSLHNLNNFKGTNTTLYLNDVIVKALPGVIPDSLLRSTAGNRLANMCKGHSSYWLVVDTLQGKSNNNTAVSYSAGNGPVVVDVDACDVRVADILSSSLLCVRFSRKTPE